MRLENIENIAVLGTGTMAPGIAQLCAQSGYSVSMWGRTDASLQRGFNRLKSNLRTFRDNGLIAEGDDELIFSRVKGVTSLQEAVRDADFVIESVAEELTLKREIFAALDGICRQDAILSTNTSGLSITAIASTSSRPEKAIVTHFWNPPHLIPLVEIGRGQKTSQETVDVTTQLMTKIGKTPVVVQKEAPGFIGNRLQFALLREALYIVEQGIASMEDVDTAVKMSFGRRLPVTGPLETADLGGVDTFLAVSEYLMKDLCSSSQPSSLLVDAVKKGRLGIKSGTGLYEWSPESISQIAKAREEELIRFLRQDRAKPAW
ncbi:MAG: 3-hydroxyacyl-CoA dehydrogenase family protein [Dehalococcoidia bacterium]|nr:3-hydroxyacyl-CoA dehydrogenase family protein [Dehalococcoidia bacterium]